MPPFRPEEINDADWDLFQNSPVARVQDGPVLDNYITRLEAKGYRVVQFDCAAWLDEGTMHAELKERLQFPDYYGRNLDALNDCLRSLDIDSVLGIVIVLWSFESLIGNAQFRDKTPWHILDIISGRSRGHLMFGRRFMAIAQMGDEAPLAFRKLGAVFVAENRFESTNRFRRGRGLPMLTLDDWKSDHRL
jgi:RNAse (barnase) inhibitor barstar